MFFKKKQKLNAKVRFQQASFKKQVREARVYKREIKQSDSKVLNFIRGKAFLAIAFGVLVLGFYYYVGVSRQLLVKQVVVKGQGVDSQGVIATTESFLSGKVAFLFPKKSLLFFKASDLSKFVEENNKSVYKVVAVTKNWKNKIVELEVEPKVNTFIFENLIGDKFLASQDGVVSGPFFESENYKGLLLVVVGESLTVGQSPIGQNVLTGLEKVQSEFFSTTGLQVGHIEVGGVSEVSLGQGITLSRSDIIVYTTRDEIRGIGEFRVFLDPESDLSETFKNISLLLKESQKDRLVNLSYIDMRFRDKSFVCLRGTLCEKLPDPEPDPGGLEESEEGASPASTTESVDINN